MSFMLKLRLARAMGGEALCRQELPVSAARVFVPSCTPSGGLPLPAAAYPGRLFVSPARVPFPLGVAGCVELRSRRRRRRSCRHHSSCSHSCCRRRRRRLRRLAYVCGASLERESLNATNAVDVMTAAHSTV